MQLPADFITNTKPLLNDQWDNFRNALVASPPVSIRLNTSKALNNSLLAYKQVLWNNSGYYLDTRPQFTFDPLFHVGYYYVQEASSMVIAQAVSQYLSGKVNVLDLCAAPGGKSTLLADMISDESLLVSNEVIRTRANILAENMIKWGKPNVVVTNNDPKQIGHLSGFFDAILVDAPCSGEGMFRKDQQAIGEWSLENVKLCKQRQQRILADIWPALKPGGLLLYSTCTYNLQENEENVRWIKEELGAEVLPVEIEEKWGIAPSYDKDITAYRFFPHKTKGEGFFFAILRKLSDNTTEFVIKKQKKGNEKKKVEELQILYKNYIQDKEKFSFYQSDNRWYAFPRSLQKELTTLKSELNVISEGICLGEFKGKDFIPHQSLAMSISLNKESFMRCDIEWDTAISYLRKETLALPDKPKGYILLTYKNIPLGFVKNIGNRANNLYPQEWRIRSSYIPEKEVKVV